MSDLWLNIRFGSWHLQAGRPHWYNIRFVYNIFYRGKPFRVELFQLFNYAPTQEDTGMSYTDWCPASFDGHHKFGDFRDDSGGSFYAECLACHRAILIAKIINTTNTGTPSATETNLTPTQEDEK